MNKFNPRAVPPPGLHDSEGPSREAFIASLPVSVAWKAKFYLIEKAGGPSLPSIQDLAPSDIRKVRWNLLAFVFWPFYYFYLGIWKKGAVMVSIATVSVLVVTFLLDGFGLDRFIKVAWMLPGVFFCMRANVDYYRKMVLLEED